MTHDLDPAAGAMPSTREKSCAPPSGRRPRGRPKGSRNKAALAVEAVLEDAAEALVGKLIDKALAGDGVALRFCVGRLLPARRDSPVAFDLPEIAGAGDLVKAARAVLTACAGGVLSPDEATQVMDLIIAVQGIEKMGDVEKRVSELERRQQACVTRTARERATQSDHPASRRAQGASSRLGALDVSGCQIERGMRGPPPVPCKSPVFNSTASLVRSIKPPTAPKALTLCAPRFCPRGVPSIRCKSSVFNSFSATPARHRELTETRGCNTRSHTEVNPGSPRGAREVGRSRLRQIITGPSRKHPTWAPLNDSRGSEQNTCLHPLAL
jgi:hypothetical protein